MKKILMLTLATTFASFLFSQNANLWNDVAEISLADRAADRQIFPNEYRTLSLDLKAMKEVLETAPMRFSAEAQEMEVDVPIPMPDGGTKNFHIVEAPVMHPDLAAKYPDMKSYAGWSHDDPTAYLRFGVSQKGFHAVLFSSHHSSVYIDAYANGDSEHYISYFKKDYPASQNFECHVEEELKTEESEEHAFAEMVGDCQFRSYRLALACTGEYAQFHGGTVASVMAEFNVAMTRVNGIYERDAGVVMMMVPNNDELIFLNANTDPYTNSSGGTMLGQNQTTCNNVIGSANYDIGHVFSTGGGGIAGLGVICSNNNKARGVTGLPNPVGDPFYVDYVAHEMGHQFGANHTQNNSCNRNNATAMEPGSASTIMGYAGICSPDVQNNSDDYFHAISLDEIASRVTSTSCASILGGSNDAPTVTVPSGFYNLPVSTPFALTAEGDDPNGDGLSYCWEQMDNQAAPMPPSPSNTGGPAFRSLDPVESPTRYFPNLSAILSNSTPTWEVLPSVSRNMNFRVTVRDGQCTSETDVVLSFSSSAGPFVVEEPNTSMVTWTAIGTEQVMWDVANTDVSPVNASTVDIYLSEDGGLTYPYLLAESVPNIGNYTVTVPNVETTEARVMVKGHGNVFFDISDQNFTIEMSSMPTFGASIANPVVSTCQVGEVEYVIDFQSILGFNGPVELSLSGLPTGATSSFDPNPVTPAGQATLSVGGLENVAAGSYNMEVTANHPVNSISLPINLVVIDSVSATVSAPSPADGSTGLPSTSVSLTWEAISGADAYSVEVSDNPSFDNILANATTTGEQYIFTAGVPEQVYYWRVKPLGFCNDGDFSSTFAFQTSGFECDQFNSGDTPIAISSTQGGTIGSEIEVNLNNPVATIYAYMDISHSYVGDLFATLTGPGGGTGVVLFDQPGVPTSTFGCANADLEVGFSESAALTAEDFENTCGNNPAISGTFQSINPMSNFIGDDAMGTWTLEISDFYPQSDGGALNSWFLEICGAIAPDAAVLLTNNVLQVPQGLSETVSQNFLEVDGAPGAVLFTLLSLPENGILYLDGVALEIGGQFTQADVNGGLVTYIHDGSATVADEFSFDVVEGGLHWLHNQIFQIEIVENGITASAVLTQGIACHNDETGGITATAVGGNGPLEYSLNGGTYQSSNVFDGLSAGTYTITVRDNDGLTVTTNLVEINNPAAIVLSADVMNDDLTVNASGGTGGLAYSLDGVNYQPSNVFENLPNGTYTVYVRDENDCVETTTAVVAVNTIIVSLVLTEDVTCAGNDDGVVTATAGGGSTPYMYSINGGPFQSSNVFTDLAPGDYTVTVMDADGFTQLSNVATVTEPDELTASASVVNADLTISEDGGTPPFEYSVDGVNYQPSNVFENLPNGTYTISVIDANGCEAMAMATVSVNNLSVAVSVVEHVSCAGANDGLIEVNAQGGSMPFEYSLNGGPAQSSNVFENVPSGMSEVTVTDADGFTQTVSFSVTEPAPIAGGVSANGYTVTVNASGGTGSLVYSLDGGTFQSSNEFFPLENGSYTVTVLDDNECETTFDVTVDVPALGGSLSFDMMLECNDSQNGTITIDPSGGVGPFEYSLNGGAFQSNNIFENLGAGSYEITIRDSGGFETTLSAVTISAPAAISANTDISGNNVTVNASGGTGSLIYSLDGGPFQSSNIFTNVANGNHTVTVQDVNGCEITINVPVNTAPLQMTAELVEEISCVGAMDGVILISAAGGVEPLEYSINGIDFQSDNTFVGLPAGTYQPTVKDATGALIIAPTITVVNPFPIVLQGSTFGPVITMDASGGAEGFTFSFDGGPFQSDNTFEVVSNGFYAVVVMDANGCTEEIEVEVNKPEALIYQVTPATCADSEDGVIFIQEVDGGFSPYEFSLNGGPYSPQTIYGGNAAGEYVISVIDATGYEWFAPAIIIDAPPAIVVETELSDNNLTVNASGGVGAFQYSIDGGGTFQDENIFENLPDGTYPVVVMDENGCLAETEVTINVNSIVEANGGLIFEVSPNPSRGVFILSMESPSGKSMDLTVHDVAGRLVFENTIPGGQRATHELDLQFLNNGSYHLRVSDGETWGVKKLILVK